MVSVLLSAYLWVEQVCVHHSTLDVVQVCIVLKCPLQESSLLTKLGDVGTVVVGEHLVAQDSISNLHQRHVAKKKVRKSAGQDLFI